MKEIGLNKRLYDRRLELGYSVKEACIRLDISKIKLSLIENGYRKVKDKKLQKRFILRYKLPENFFEETGLEYPSPLEDEVEEEKESKFVKLCKKLPFKIALILLTVGGALTFASGISRMYAMEDKMFCSQKYSDVYDYIDKNGTEYSQLNAKTSQLLLCDYKSIKEDLDPVTCNDFFEVSINSFTKYVEYAGYTFFEGGAYLDAETLSKLTGLHFEEGTTIFFESRPNGLSERLHFYAYGDTDFPLQTVHFSADFDTLTYKFTYNLIEVRDIENNYVRETNDTFYVSIYKTIFEQEYIDYAYARDYFIKSKTDVFKYQSYDEFSADQIKGLADYNYYLDTNYGLIVGGIVFTTLCFAMFILCLIVTTKFGKKVMDVVTIEQDKSVTETRKEREFKPLPKNNLPAPILPEALIRVVAFVLMVIGSMSLYYIFSAIMNGDIIGTLESLQYRAAVASFSTIGMILIFFIKLDIIQNKKSTFLLNYILFFAGFIFYVLTVLIAAQMNYSPALSRFKVLLDFLPGNIVWGILAFNLLTSILLSKPKFKTNVRRNTIIYRCLAILPLGYMIASSIIQIGKKVWGWNLPLWASSLFFTKALIITTFTILYVLVIFIYRKIIDYKYGKENAEVYTLGNRYQYIKNLIIAGVFALLGVIDLFLGKTPEGVKMGFGSNIGILYLIPLILLYHPHRGPRNKKWDMVFNIAYGFSLLIGIICIISSISVYITSL